MGVRARFGRPARSQARIPASVARGRETELAAGPGPSAGWGSGRRWRVGPAGQGGRRAARASGRLRERGCGAGRVGAGYWPWAELGRSAALGKGGTGRRRERRRPGPRWAGPGVWALVWAARKGLDWVLVCWALGLGFLSFSIPYSSPFLNLFQTKFEFKYEFEFKPHSNKSMHQHECNTNF